MLWIENVTLVTPERLLPRQDVFIDNGRIAAIQNSGEVHEAAGARRIQGNGLLLTPGWIDCQLNGGFGHDFTEDPTTMWDVAAQLPRFGVTAFLPTIITSPLARIAEAMAVWQAGTPAGWRGARPLGLHIEGPFLNPQKRGAHNPIHLRLPDPAAVADWSPEHGVWWVTLAPELPGALDLARFLRQRGVIVSAGHTMATFEEAEAAFKAGVMCGTHLFNAMAPLAHREPGMAGALLTNPEAVVGLIADGIHTHPAMVEIAWRCKGPHRIITVTDGMAALGMPPGRYHLGDLEVIVGETDARLPNGTLAGSIATLDQALRNVQRFVGCSLTEAVTTVTRTPAELFGLPKGRILVGYDADLTLITPRCEVVATIVGGEVVYERLDRVEVSSSAPFDDETMLIGVVA